MYARLEPFLAEVRQRTGMEGFAAHMQKFVESSPEAQERVERFQQRFAAMRAEAAEAGRLAQIFANVGIGGSAASSAAVPSKMIFPSRRIRNFGVKVAGTVRPPAAPSCSAARSK